MDESRNREVFIQKFLLTFFNREDVTIFIAYVEPFGLEHYSFNFLGQSGLEDILESGITYS
jgi:hypothetical protein